MYYRKSGQLTPACFYDDCYLHRGEPVILDDIEELLDAPLGAKLVSALGDTTPVKQLSWDIRSRLPADIPKSFATTSPLCILANKSTTHKAIQSRALILYFDPTNEEIHRAAARWYWDQEIHDWIGRHIYRLKALDIRWYIHASNDKAVPRDWRQIILRTHATNPKVCIVQDLEGDPATPTCDDRVRRFIELTGASRRTYFRLRAKLEKANNLKPRIVAPILLGHTRRPSIPSIAELDAMAQDTDAPAQPQEQPAPLDVPLREEFREPVRGQVPPREAAPRPTLDDTTPLDRPPPDDEE